LTIVFHTVYSKESMGQMEEIEVRHKRISIFAIILLVFLGASLWIFFVTIQVLPNPFIPVDVETVILPTPRPTSNVEVPVETQYQNPFDENTQYVNPFSSYQNPFDSIE